MSFLASPLPLTVFFSLPVKGRKLAALLLNCFAFVAILCIMAQVIFNGWFLLLSFIRKKGTVFRWIVPSGHAEALSSYPSCQRAEAIRGPPLPVLLLSSVVSDMATDNGHLLKRMDYNRHFVLNSFLEGRGRIL